MWEVFGLNDDDDDNGDVDHVFGVGGFCCSLVGLRIRTTCHNMTSSSLLQQRSLYADSRRLICALERQIRSLGDDKELQ